MYSYSDKPKRDMRYPASPLAAGLKYIYEGVAAIVGYSLAIGLVTLASYGVTALVLRLVAR